MQKTDMSVHRMGLYMKFTSLKVYDRHISTPSWWHGSAGGPSDPGYRRSPGPDPGWGALFFRPSINVIGQVLR